MNLCTRRTLATAAGVCALLLGACQGNLGTGGGGGIGLPQTPGYGQGQGQGQGQPGVPAAASRQRVLDGAVTRAPDLDAIPLPALEGFSVSLALGTPTPKPSPSQTPAPATSGSAKHSRGVAERSAHPRATLPTASPTPSPEPSVSPSSSPNLSAAASTTAPDASKADKIATKTTIYPDDAPSPPTPQPSGNVQTFIKRTPLVRGYLSAGQDVALYGLGAVRFSIPPAETTAQRGFTVAIFEAGKKHRDKLVAYDAQATQSDGVVASSLANDPLTLKKNTGYLLMLYGDELPATPAPAVSGYPSPGNNPFVTPIPSGYPGGPGGPPAGAASAPPYGTATVPPSALPSHL